MAFDTLQRWHETKHIDTSPMRITPAVRTPIVKQGPWAAINEALGRVLPELDPLNIAKRRLAMKSVPLQEAQINSQLQMLPLQQELQNRSMQMMLKAMSGRGIPGWELSPDGKTWRKTSDEELRKRQNAADAQHNANILEDSLKHHIQNNVEPEANASPPSDTPQVAAPPWANPDIFSGQSAGSPIPDLSGTLAGSDTEDQNIYG